MHAPGARSSHCFAGHREGTERDEEFPAGQRRLAIWVVNRKNVFLFGFFFIFCGGGGGGVPLLAFRLLGFSPVWLLGFSSSCWFMRLLVAFWLWIFASSAFPLWRFGFCGFSLLCDFCTLLLVFGFGFPHPQRHKFLMFMFMYACMNVCLYVCTASNIIGKPPPNPPAAFYILSHPS